MELQNKIQKRGKPAKKDEYYENVINELQEELEQYRAMVP